MSRVLLKPLQNSWENTYSFKIYKDIISEISAKHAEFALCDLSCIAVAIPVYVHRVHWGTVYVWGAIDLH
jgi:hypothetical protein